LTAGWALILPLALDTFAVAAALGVQRLDPRARMRVTALFTVFEGGMPLAGAAAGGVLGRAIGEAGHWVAVAVLAGAGVLMLLRRDDDEGRLESLARASGPLLLALGVSISLDELAIGFSLAVLRLPLGILCLVIAVQAAAATQLGLRLGRRVGEEMRENAERAAGVALIALAIVLLVLH
jgi:putative Mn2+ efflux pump MntP